MDELLNAVAALIALVSPEKVKAVADRVRQTEATKAVISLVSVVGTPAASRVVEQLALAWQRTEISSDELALMLISASHVYTKSQAHQTTELVWTGPTTPFVSARRTEQSLLQVINSAEHSLFITSFVAYDVSTIVEALNAALKRNVVISMLLELSQDHGGSISFDTIGKMKSLVPAAKLYAWHEKSDSFVDGRVHAKVAVADERICFITSANLTGYAMEKNMELGVIIEGGSIPLSLKEHLDALVTTNVITPI